MKSVDSARHSVEHLDDGRIRFAIEHENMAGVTPRMMRWWFENIDAWTRYNGEDFTGPLVPVYRYWHPHDHISVRWHRRVTIDGRLAPGSIIHIEENLGGKHPVRAKARVTRFDDEAFNFDILLAGVVPVGALLHLYTAVEGGASFYTEALIGVRLPIVGRLFNALIRRLAFSEEMMMDWITHNVEESGETEKFVPALFEEARRRSATGAHRNPS